MSKRKFEDDDVKIIDQIPKQKLKLGNTNPHSLSNTDLDSLKKGEKISNSTINASFDYICYKTKSQYFKTQVLEYVTSLLEGKSNDVGYVLSKMFEYGSIDWKRKGFVFIPWIQHDHWTLIAVDLRKGLILFFDSMGNDETFFQQIQQWKTWFSIEMMGLPKEILTYRVINCTKQRQHQVEGLSCGAFVCFYAELLSRGVPYEIIRDHPRCNPNDMLFYRHELTNRILRFLQKY
jgi:Ulp1 family protease